MSQSNFAERFEDLRVWQDARAQASQLYREFGDNTSASKDFGFRDQIQRASVSVMNNIAEGFERGYQTEFARFLKITKGSCGEVRSMLYLAEDLGYLDSEKLSRSIASLESNIRKKLK